MFSNILVMYVLNDNNFGNCITFGRLKIALLSFSMNITDHLNIIATNFFFYLFFINSSNELIQLLGRVKALVHSYICKKYLPMWVLQLSIYTTKFTIELQIKSLFKILAPPIFKTTL